MPVLLHHHWRKALGRLVHEHQLRIDHQRAADRQHAALALGPAIDAARSPERRVKTKLTTSTVKHTAAASHALRTMNNAMGENYDSELNTSSSDMEALE